MIPIHVSSSEYLWSFFVLYFLLTLFIQWWTPRQGRAFWLSTITDTYKMYLRCNEVQVQQLTEYTDKKYKNKKVVGHSRVRKARLSESKHKKSIIAQ
jgi:hypothetical protein